MIEKLNYTMHSRYNDPSNFIKKHSANGQRLYGIASNHL